MDCSWCGDEMKENMLHICIEPEEADPSLGSMKILDASQLSVGVEEHLLIEHQGECYRRVAWYSENASGYDWFIGKQRIEDPDWADDHDWDELFQHHYGLKK